MKNYKRTYYNPIAPRIIALETIFRRTIYLMASCEVVYGLIRYYGL